MIRDVQIKDAERIAEIFSYYVTNTTISFEVIAPTSDEIQKRIIEYTKSYPWLVYEVNGTIVGYAYANKFKAREAYKYTVELSVYFDIDNCRKGYGKEIIKALLKKLKELNYFTATACIDYPNENSQKLFESLGFECVGISKNVGRKFNRWLSIIDYTYPIQDYNNF